MKYLHALFLTFMLSVAGSPAVSHAGEWHLPEGMEWHPKSEGYDGCRTVGKNAPVIGCFFGGEYSARDAGEAFFRMCGNPPSRERQPFLVVDLEQRRYDFYLKHNGELTVSGSLDGRIAIGGPPDVRGVNVGPFFLAVATISGDCRLDLST